MEQSATPWRVFDAPAAGSGPGEQPDATPNSKPGRAVDPKTTKVAITGVAGAVAIGLVAIAVALSGSGEQIIDGPGKAFAGPTDAGAALLAGSGRVVVDVTGAVTKPGVYELPAGARVADAIDAAGGFSPRVDADKVAAALNLAEPLKDGSQVHVPSRDEAAATGTAGGATGGSVGGGAGGGATNLNTATQSELEALPGIGPVTATKIIESRTAQPFTSVDDLRTRKLVGEKTFDQLKSLVTVD